MHFMLERFPSGQREQTVNLSVYAFVGSNPTLSTIVEEVFMAGTSRVGAGIAQLVEHQPSKLRVAGSSPVSRSRYLGKWAPCPRSSVAERFLGKEEVMGPIPIVGSTMLATGTCN